MRLKSVRVRISLLTMSQTKVDMNLRLNNKPTEIIGFGSAIIVWMRIVQLKVFNSKTVHKACVALPLWTITR